MGFIDEIVNDGGHVQGLADGYDDYIAAVLGGHVIAPPFDTVANPEQYRQGWAEGYVQAAQDHEVSKRWNRNIGATKGRRVHG